MSSTIALRACLNIISARPSRHRDQWYLHIFNIAKNSLTKTSMESIHAGLLVYGELVANSDSFIINRFNKIADDALKFQDHKDKCVRTSIIQLIPKLAQFNPKAFAK